MSDWQKVAEGLAGAAQAIVHLIDMSTLLDPVKANQQLINLSSQQRGECRHRVEKEAGRTAARV